MKLNFPIYFSLLLPLLALCAWSFIPETTSPVLKSESGVIAGKITYDDKVPNFKPVNLDKFPECAEYAPLYKNMLVLGDGNTLANVLVRVKSGQPMGATAPKEAVVIDQNGCVFSPKVTALMVGQPLIFKNSDGILYNVHGLPKVNKEFNIGMPPSVAESEPISFDKAESPFPVKCDVHPWMTSYVAVMTHPYFAITGEDGKFKLENLPDGAYEIEAWHEKLGTRTANVTVHGGEARVNFSFKAPHDHKH